MIIYVDILFLKHVIMNYCLITITSKLLKKKTKVRNKIVASLFTSLYSILAILYPLVIWYSVIAKIFLAIVIVEITYRSKELGEMIQDVIMLYVVTYFIGGIMTEIINYIPEQMIGAMLAILIGYVLSLLARKIFHDHIRRENYQCKIQIQLGNELWWAKALIDTGHDLQDTISGETVMIMTEKKIEELSKELSTILKGEAIEIPSQYETKIRMVSYQSIGKQEGILYGIQVDKVTIYYDGAIIENKNVILALTENQFQKFDAILGLNVLEEGEKIGNTAIIKVEGKKTLDKNFNYD